MTKVLKLCTFFTFIAFTSRAQTFQALKEEKKKDGVFYFALGTHRIFFTPGDMHFNRYADPVFNFTLKKVRGKDEGGLKFHTAPQFSYTVGYYFTKKKFGIEYQYDHIKFFVRQNQVVHLTGSIHGKSYDLDTMITPEFLKFEHSDGGNYAMVNLVKWIPLSSEKNKKYSFDLIIKGGAGVVNPKTNSTVMGYHRDDKYHISGYVIGVESGLRFNFLKHLFATGSFKGAYANYTDFLIEKGHGSQKWLSVQFNYLLGARFPL